MKQYFLLTIAAFGINTVCLAQKEEKISKPPEAAKAALTKTFPGATNIKWEKENANYEASFKQNGKSMSAEFNDSGTLIESEVTIRISELPSSVVQYVNEHYKGKSIKEAAKITRSNGDINYEAEVNKKDMVFDSKGKFLKEEKD